MFVFAVGIQDTVADPGLCTGAAIVGGGSLWLTDATSLQVWENIGDDHYETRT